MPEILIIPEDYGAVGDGVTDDSNAFIEGNYIYNLDANKVYRIQQKLPIPPWAPKTPMKSVESYISLIHETTPEQLRTLFYT